MMPLAARTALRRAAAPGALLAMAVCVAGAQEAITFTDVERARIAQLSPLGDPPPDPTNRHADDPAAAHLGRFLFHDERLSGAGDVSCATCHDPARAFADGRARAQGAGLGPRNTPSLLNAAYQRWLFWDGRADSLWAQALQPLERDIEMNGDRRAIAGLIERDPALREAYEGVFGPWPGNEAGMVDRVFVNVAKAIAAYERTLVSRNSSFDRFASGLANGDPSAMAAISPAAQRGLKLFVGKAGCRMCHHGPLISDGEFHNIGVPPHPEVPGRDSGRYDGVRLLAANPYREDGAFNDADPYVRPVQVRQGPELWGQFRTPSLRNVAVTAPYMHQGQFETLRDVIVFYSTRDGAVSAGHHQEQILAPLELTEAEIDDLIAFFEALACDTSQIRAPVLPRVN